MPFDLHTFWKDQNRIALYHGTIRQKLDRILVEGLIPGQNGRVYFSSSMRQASQYARMGGEAEYLEKRKNGIPKEEAIYPDEDIRILELHLPPDLIYLTGGGVFKDKQTWTEKKDLILESFEDDPNQLYLEFKSDHIIPPEHIAHIHTHETVPKFSI